MPQRGDNCLALALCLLWMRWGGGSTHRPTPCPKTRLLSGHNLHWEWKWEPSGGGMATLSLVSEELGLSSIS